MVYLAQSFRYTQTYGNFDESASYIWLLGTPDGYCSAGGTQPATYLGNWGPAEYGPYLRATTGARRLGGRACARDALAGQRQGGIAESARRSPSAPPLPHEPLAGAQAQHPPEVVPNQRGVGG